MWQMLRQIFRVGLRTQPPPAADPAMLETVLHADIARVFGRALCIRHVDAGSCNGCELELNALGNPYYNLEGLGIKFVASPRHADALLVTGPMTRNMAGALQRAYAAMPEPKLVIAAGDCAACGGVFGESYACLGQVARVIPVDVTVPGCPPSPTALLQGILAALRPAANLNRGKLAPAGRT
jgi:Ni,Fe-hydrogenase III small subunit